MPGQQKRLFPSLRCSMGNRYYYVTYMTFQDIVEWIKPTTEIHNSERLSDWIQRQLRDDHAKEISSYLRNNEERFFSAIVVGVYGGDPEWAPLTVGRPADVEAYDLTPADTEHLEASIGLLHFKGDENLFTIDGQHRVAGIKQALQDSPSLQTEEVCAVFVGHQNTSEGLRVTRRLFTTLNKTAKRVSDADIVALDEDNGFAVITRMLVDDFNTFRDSQLVAFAPKASLRPEDKSSLTSIVSLYQQTKDLYVDTFCHEALKRNEVMHSRPSDKSLQEIFTETCNYWKILFETVGELKAVISGRNQPGDFRAVKHNHLLFRPIGQRAFAGAVSLLIQRGYSMSDAVAQLARVKLWLHKEMWHHVLWDPVRQVMLRSHTAAETLLLYSIGEKGRSKARDDGLRRLLYARDNHDL